MTTVYQAYFIGLMVNPGFEKSITTQNDPIQSGIEYEYPDEMDILTFSNFCTKLSRKIERFLSPPIRVYSVL
jgi:hypothetical protein